MKQYDRTVHTIIALENVGILWDIFMNHGAISWPKIGFLFSSILLLYGLWFLHYRTEKRKEPPAVSGISTADQLASTHKEIARVRIDELAKQAEWMEGKVPRDGQATESNFCEFWAEDAARWSVAVEQLLRLHYGKAAAENFTSGVGSNSQEPVGNVHKNAADAFRLLLHRQRSLKNIRLTLNP